jgi:hypothetical protein
LANYLGLLPKNGSFKKLDVEGSFMDLMGITGVLRYSGSFLKKVEFLWVL